MADLTYLPPMSADSRRRLLQLQQDTPLNSTARIAVTENNEPTLKANARMVTITTLAAYTRTVNTLEANANGAMGTIDGVAPAVGDRFLLKNGAAGADNGLYTVTTLGGASSKWGAIRSEDADATYKVTPGLSVFISEGTTQADTFWTITTNAPITLNTTSITFSETSAAGFALYATLALTTNANGASLIGIEDSATKITGTNVETALAEIALHKYNLGLTTNANGASLIGIEDSGSLLTAVNVETATAELAAYAIGTAGGSGTTGAIHNARYLKGTYSFAAQGGVQGDIAIASVQVPMGAMVTRLIYNVTTPFTSGGAAQIAFKIQNAGDLIGAAILATNGTAGPHGAAPLVTPIVLSAARTLTMTVSVADLTAGVANFYLEYVN